MIGAGGTAILGLLYWSLATHAYPPHQVGVQSALISSMLFLAGLSQLSLNSVLIRFLPVSGRDSGKLIMWAYASSIAAGAVAATIFVSGTPLWSVKLSFLLHNLFWFAAFVAGTVAWCVFSLQDSVLAALRRAGWVPVENISVSFAKIGLLALFASKALDAGLFASWTISAGLAVLAINVLIFRNVIPRLGAVDPLEKYTTRSVLRFGGGNYVGFIFYAASANLLPLVVLDRAGATDAGYFFLPWAIASALMVIAASAATSLTIESVRDMAQLRSHCRRALAHTLALTAAPVAVLVLAAPTLLDLFGHGYAEHGATTLRLLAIGALPNVIVLAGLALLRIQQRVVKLAALQAVACVLLLGLSYVLLPEYGLPGVGIAFILSQTTTALLIIVYELRPVLRRVASARAE